MIIGDWWLRKGMGIVTIHERFGESHPQPTSVRLIDWWMSWWHPCHRLVNHVISHLRMIPVDSATDRSNDFAWSLHTEDMIHQLVDCEHSILIPLSTVFPTIYIDIHMYIYIYYIPKILPWVTLDIHGYPSCPMIIPYLFPYQRWCSPLGAPSSPEFSQDFAAPSALAVLEAGGPRGTQGDPGHWCRPCRWAMGWRAWMLGYNGYETRN